MVDGETCCTCVCGKGGDGVWRRVKLRHEELDYFLLILLPCSSLAMRVPQHLLLLAVATLVSQCVGFHIQRVVVGLYSSSVGDSWYGFKSNSNNNNHHHHHHVFPTLPRTTAGRRTPRRLITAVAVQTNSNNGGASETSVQDDYADIKAELTNYLAFREQVGADEAMKKEAGKIVGGTKGNVVLDYVSGSPNKEITLEMPNIFDYSELDKYGFGVRLLSLPMDCLQIYSGYCH